MKQALLIMLLVCPFALGFGSSTVFAQQSGGGNYPAGSGVRVKEVDGAPNVPGTQTLVFPNGSLTRAGQTVTVTLSGGGLTVGTTTITGGTDTKSLYNNAGVVGERTVTGTGNDVLSASPTLTGTVAMAAQTNTGTIVQTSASATAFESGPNGSTNPVFRLVNSTASSATGISVTGAAAGSGVTIAAISSSSNELLILAPKGTGTVSPAVNATTSLGIETTQAFKNAFFSGYVTAVGGVYNFSSGGNSAGYDFYSGAPKHLISGAGGTAFVGFGGTSSSFPALKRSTTTLQVRLADDSADADLKASRYITGGSAPTVGGSCGTSPSIAGTDSAGKVTSGTVAPTSCTVTFSVAWTNAPACMAVNETTANLLRATSTTTTVVLAGTMAASDVLSYVCVGY